ncbi:hypothetical protein [uncultured Anaerococcus sp.]|uniref:hypothetical protein n=1 Tax=uncultured Anaerococcus sp. TaxID=293428 RepID=UPI00260958F1|nr:hypothetical protein [uncultured Anaerococcus sp.]
MNLKDTVPKNIDNITYDIPTICPHCHQKMMPIILEKSIMHSDAFGNTKQALLVQCQYCGEYFALSYKIKFIATSRKYVTEYIPYTYSYDPNLVIPDEISSFSKDFKEIYRQSLIAEHYKLNQIAGIGYRKATEFLVKDFLINHKKMDKDKTSKLPLKQAIERLNSQKIINLGLATTYLGNDEAHYTRKHNDRDINDLKKLLNALVYYLSLEVISSEASSIIDEN